MNNITVNIVILSAGHSNEKSVVSLNHFDVVDCKSVIDCYRNDCLDTIVRKGFADSDVGNLHNVFSF